MREEIIRVIEEHNVGGTLFQIVETKYEYGSHYVLLMNGESGFHSTDIERVQKYMNSMIKMFE